MSVLIAFLSTPVFIDVIESHNKYIASNLQQSLCFVKKHTNKDCPACGLSRSIFAFYRGDFSSSQKYHPAGYILVLILVSEFSLRTLPLAIKSLWIPWIDICQLIGIGFLFKILFL